MLVLVCWCLRAGVGVLVLVCWRWRVGVGVGIGIGVCSGFGVGSTEPCTVGVDVADGAQLPFCRLARLLFYQLRATHHISPITLVSY